MSRNATPQGPGGEFATSRRGGLTQTEIREIEAHRAKERPTPWAALARRYGRCEADIRALYAQAEPEPAPEQPTRKNFPWNDDQMSMLLRDYGKVSNPVLAARLGVGVNALHGKAHRLGITQPRGWNRAA